jgi:hypothetical protein
MWRFDRAFWYLFVDARYYFNYIVNHVDTINCTENPSNMTSYLARANRTDDSISVYPAGFDVSRTRNKETGIRYCP